MMHRARLRAFKCRQGVHRLKELAPGWSNCKDCPTTFIALSPSVFPGTGEWTDSTDFPFAPVVGEVIDLTGATYPVNPLH